MALIIASADHRDSLIIDLSTETQSVAVASGLFTVDGVLVDARVAPATIDVSGDDSIWDNGAYRDRLEAGTGNDTIVDSTIGDAEGGNTLNGGAGADSLVAGSGGYDVLIGGLGDDTIIDLGGTSNYLVGGEWADLGASDTGRDRLTAGKGYFDQVYGGGGDDVLLDNGGGGSSLVGGSGNDSLTTDAAMDSLTSGNGDGLYGEEGDDTLVDSWGGGNTLDGGSGNDRLVVSGTIGANLLLGGAGRDTILGSLGRDTLVSNALEDMGSDTLSGDFGAEVDVLSGGAGNDHYFVGTEDVVKEYSGGGIDTVHANYSWTLGAEFEVLITGGDGTGNLLDNRIMTGDGGHLLRGLAGNDTLSGGGSDDTLDGGAGNDSLIGGYGDDVYLVDSVNDRIFEVADRGTDLVRSTISLTLGSTIENLTLLTTLPLAGTGNALINVIIGNSASNRISGGGEFDSLWGGGGADTLDGGFDTDFLVGGLGDDLFLVDRSSDVVVEALNQGVDTVSTFAATYRLPSNVEVLLANSAIAHTLTGNALGNVIIGNVDADSLVGLGGIDTLLSGSGNDRLDGGTGADSMTGGLGNDTYIVDSAGDVVSEAAGAGIDTVLSAVNVWPAPSARGFAILPGQSTPTYPVSGRSPGQDGDPRALVLIITSASSAIERVRFPGRQSTVRPSRFHHPQTSSAVRAG